MVKETEIAISELIVKSNVSVLFCLKTALFFNQIMSLEYHSKENLPQNQFDENTITDNNCSSKSWHQFCMSLCAFQYVT